MILDGLSEAQAKAVTAVEGPVLVLAGAGSGKTTVLTKRVAYLLQEKDADPYSILAITFTNKAANEMRERIHALVGQDTPGMIVSTFHSMCARFLRRDAEKLGYTNAFSVYDADAAQLIIKKILQKRDISTKVITPRACAAAVSAAKNANAESPRGIFFQRFGSFTDQLSEIYCEYNERLKTENAMDFDDLLLNMLKLLKNDEQTRQYYQNRFRYVLVDEYQDTNSVQYELVKLFSGKYKNLFVVGDDDQSIYAWRGADVRNILDFEKDYPNAAVLKLEENYRSHIKILNAANSVIKKANERKDKTLWSKKTNGELPKVCCLPDEYREAEFIATRIAGMKEEGRAYSDFAILYRTHTQSRAIEEKLRQYGIPYHIYGGISFYDRKEIKDMLAYLYIIDNPDSDTSLLRVINVPKRGIGDATISKLTDYAVRNGKSLLDAIYAANSFLSGAAAARLESFRKCYNALIDCADESGSVAELIEGVYRISGYRDMITSENDAEAQSRAEHIEELMNSAEGFEEAGGENAGLTEFLSNVSLITSLDTTSDDGAVTLMTLHSAKGLEFDTVFLSGMEDNIFPSQRSKAENKLDEERRLCYVGITRAKENLFMTYCEQRHFYDGIRRSQPSQFLDDIPPSMKEELNKRPVKAAPSIETSRAPQASAPRRPMPSFASKAEVADASVFRAGQTVEHPKFGRGKIISIAQAGKNNIAVIAFADGERKMFLEYAPLKIV